MPLCALSPQTVDCSVQNNSNQDQVILVPACVCASVCVCVTVAVCNCASKTVACGATENCIGLHCTGPPTELQGLLLACIPGVQFAQDKHSALTKMEQPAYFASATAPIQHDSKPNAAPSLSALTAPLWLPVSSCMMPTGGSCLPTSCRPLLTGGSFLPTGGAFDPSDGISSIIRALALGTSPEQLHGLLQDLQARGNCQQVGPPSPLLATTSCSACWPASCRNCTTFLTTPS